MSNDIVELTSRLVAIESINPGLVVGGSGEREAARAVAEWCERRGFDVELVGDERPSVIARRRATRAGGRSLLLNGHLDTVGVAGMEAPLEPRVEGDRLYGRGAFDMKGALAACLVAAAEVDADVIVTAVADEELASVGTETVLEHVRADAAIVAEPTDLQVAVAHRGFVGFEIETSGVAAHGSMPHLGDDAIRKIGPVLVALDELD
ncbi:MAG TPA: M20/M25/M40 family metallo-hydrolase, partial [Casimicrobiaceae bacterium]|nr:M20/M25/M40 family metallo-hydrolase [Casimicrobiaceae bacterium]